MVTCWFGSGSPIPHIFDVCGAPWRHLSYAFLNPFTVRCIFTTSGKLFHSFSTLTVKKFLRTSNCALWPTITSLRLSSSPSTTMENKSQVGCAVVRIWLKLRRIHLIVHALTRLLLLRALPQTFARLITPRSISAGPLTHLLACLLVLLACHLFWIDHFAWSRACEKEFLGLFWRGFHTKLFQLRLPSSGLSNPQCTADWNDIDAFN